MKTRQSMKTKKDSQSGQRINFNRMALSNFTDVSIPKNLISLTIQENYITDFIGLDSCQTLESLMVDRNPIISFHGFPQVPNLVNLSMIDTPISKLSNFRALAVIVAGEQLKTLNGIEVSSNDHAAALAYGPPEIISQLVVRGWIPKRPVALPKQKLRKNEANEINGDCRIFKLIADQSNDPISVKITRVLRAQGYNITQIRDFLHDYFSPHTPQTKQSKSQKEDSSIEAQIKKQQQIIDVLAAQLQALRSGNQTFNDYDQMIKSYGANLLKNAELLRQEEIDEQKINENPQEIKKTNIPDYETLRNAIVDFLQVEDTWDDDDLIYYLESVNVVEETQKIVTKEFIEVEDKEEEEEEHKEEEENIDENNKKDSNDIDYQSETHNKADEIEIDENSQNEDGDQNDLFERMNRIIEEEEELEKNFEEEEESSIDNQDVIEKPDEEQ